MMNEQIDPDAPISGTNVPKTIPQVTTAPAAPDTSLIDVRIIGAGQSLYTDITCPIASSHF